MKIPERSFKRRFTQATGIPHSTTCSDCARRDCKATAFEKSNAAIEEINWAVATRNLALFRRLFTRITDAPPDADTACPAILHAPPFQPDKHLLSPSRSLVGEPAGGELLAKSVAVVRNERGTPVCERGTTG